MDMLVRNLRLWSEPEDGEDYTNQYALTRPLVQIGSSFIDFTSCNDIVISKILD